MRKSFIVPMETRHLLTAEATMRKGQRVRLRASSQAARDWGVSTGAEGAVICQYRLLKARAANPERIDVQFGPKTVVWGAPATAFEVVG